MQLLTAARKRLLSDPTIDGYVAKKVWKLRLEQQLDGTGGLAVVVSQNGGWVTPDTVQTTKYPLLRIDAVADNSRLPSGEIATLDAVDKAGALQQVIDKLIHGKRGEIWGGANGLLIVSVARWREPVLYTHDDAHGGNRAVGDKNLGDCVYWRTEYALQTG